MENRTGLTTSLEESFLNRVREKAEKSRLEFARISQIRGTILCLVEDIKTMDSMSEGDSSIYYDCLKSAIKNALDNVELAVTLKENKFRMLKHDLDVEEVSNASSGKFIADIKEREKAIAKIDDEYLNLSYPF